MAAISPILQTEPSESVSRRFAFLFHTEDTEDTEDTEFFIFLKLRVLCVLCVKQESRYFQAEIAAVCFEKLFFYSNLNCIGRI
jgi:hypothetical protein